MFPLLRCLLMLSPSLLLAPLNKNFKSSFSLQTIFRCQIFPCEYWKFGVLVFAVLFTWEIAWDYCFADDEKTALCEYFRHWWNSKSHSFECCLETKMRRDIKLLYDVMADTIGYIQGKMRAASLQLARTHTRFTQWARFARNQIINSHRFALRASLREE